MKRVQNVVVSALLLMSAMVTAQPAAATAAPLARKEARGFPLPAAMIRLAIPDVPAFSAATSGGFKKALHGTLAQDDGVAQGFNQSQVGAKLVDQWSRFKGDTALSFATIESLQASALALAVLNIGHLEMALIVETPASALPELFEAGTSRVESGRTYHLVRTGAADEGSDGETRMGLAWARDAGFLIITTSERAMKLTLAAVASGQKFTPKLDGLASLELDIDALHGDLYFGRDYFFGAIADAKDARGRIHAALRLEGNRLVEVREGTSETKSGRGVVFDAKDAVASGWVADGATLLAELRRGVIEPHPDPSLLPQTALTALPQSKPASAEDRYLVSVETALPRPGGASGEAADVAAWQALLSAQPVPGFGYVVTKSRARLLAIPWPAQKEAEFVSLIEATLARRGARLNPVATIAGAKQYSFGPGLPVLALRRAGDFLWLAPSANDLRSAPAIAWSDEVVRFAKLDLTAAREDGKRWAQVEGPRSPDAARPFADRILGLLGWMPSVKALEVERRQSGTAFSERIVFAVAPPRPAATPAPAPPAK